MTTIALLLGGLIGSFVLMSCWCWIARRRELLLTAVVSRAEAARASRLQKLGEAGTSRVYNCGKILLVDFERGMLVVERKGP